MNQMGWCGLLKSCFVEIFDDFVAVVHNTNELPPFLPARIARYRTLEGPVTLPAKSQVRIADKSDVHTEFSSG